jgi:hypothetical protein
MKKPIRIVFSFICSLAMVACEISPNIYADPEEFASGGPERGADVTVSYMYGDSSFRHSGRIEAVTAGWIVLIDTNNVKQWIARDKVIRIVLNEGPGVQSDDAP